MVRNCFWRENGFDEFEFWAKRKNDKKHGYGMESNADGSVYKGQFLEGKKHGKGSYSFPDGNLYIGEWVENRMEGRVHLD